MYEADNCPFHLCSNSIQANETEFMKTITNNSNFIMDNKSYLILSRYVLLFDDVDSRAERIIIILILYKYKWRT